MYQEEGINVEKIKWVDNQACLDTIEKPPNCVLKLLDDECKFPKGTDKGFLEKMHKGLEGAPHYEMPPKQQQDQIFGIGHYAGIVYYSIDEFLDKNKDVQQTQIFDLMEKSSDGFVKAICKYRELSAMIKMTKPVKPGTKPTVGSAFRDQLGTLVETLSHTDPWYVRCIKVKKKKKKKNEEEGKVFYISNTNTSPSRCSPTRPKLRATTTTTWYSISCVTLVCWTLFASVRWATPSSCRAKCSA